MKMIDRQEARARERKAFGQEGTLWGGQCLQVSYGLRYYAPIYRKRKVWSSGERCSAYFWKVSLAKGFHSGKCGYGESIGFRPLANFSLVAPAWPFHVKVGFENGTTSLEGAI